MSRYINIDDISLRKTISVGGLSAKALWRRIQQEPSIDIVFCKECKWRGEQTESGIPYYWCRLVGVGYEVPIEHYCSYGERKESE